MSQSNGLNYEGQRETILASTAALFAQRGYHGTSMNDVADACGLSKSTLYHYYRDKNELLANIADAHVSRLVQLCQSVVGNPSVTAPERLATLISRFLDEYAGAQNSHRVLTEDVRFLPPVVRKRILDKERFVVQSFADAISLMRPDVEDARLDKAIAMLLFGMLNWMFTWLRGNGSLTHASVAPLVSSLFFDGLSGMKVPEDTVAAPSRARRSNPVTTKRTDRTSGKP
jgi:AcrR family transcriptional regulator